MKFAVAYNTTAGPVIVDDDGRTLGGGERGPVDTSEQAVKDAVDAGRLILTPDPGKEASQDAVDAHAASGTLNARVDAFSDLDQPALLKLAQDAGLVGEDDKPTKTELVALLVRSDADPPEPAAQQEAAPPPAQHTSSKSSTKAKE